MITDLSVGNIPVFGYVSRKIILSYVPENQKIHLLDGLRDRLNIINRNIQNTQRIFKEDSSTITYDNRLRRIRRIWIFI
ncbi:unnamed protein product [Rhizophagus irregularis]|uniref:Uncharacterized protein n=1 Tax=Rhizophagus irregularis TaxID=588596 RepID=A0A915ZU38_9GLOM|nr:unnamed protein product [Rhizophagus irregularis]CAB5390014.1 unnamed protein product [Rhizophagus irregularis]